ncbi:MAG: glycoside hydrolase family 127 protein [Bacteroidales bacterium]|nr:glycoside hydrolase family 127 protein [Candidatus Cacconaster merdequi]
MKSRLSLLITGVAGIAVLAVLSVGCCTSETAAGTATFPLSEITVGEPLSQRIKRNMERLQEDIYQPPHVFEDLNWPGDFIGRTVLGLAMEAEALHSDPALLHLLIDSLPGKLNGKGYLGPDYAPCINEQQLSGHGWLLRGLCEYVKWSGDRSIMPVVRSVAENLFVAGTEKYPQYPISPELRSTTGGEASGTISSEAPDWMLSTDIGCIFIGMAGLIDAYELIPEEPLKAAIDSLAARFLEVDLIAVKAQTHATLSALRGLLKYASLTGDKNLLPEIIRRWDIYENQGMTCCYGNLNWFGRPDSWTEPCAIVDSYIVAFELWKATGEVHYRNIAELIYTNALCHAQRTNGGFGCDSCPSPEDPFLKVSIPEAYWCCTMRGAEGLARVAESSWATRKDCLYVPFYRNSSVKSEGLSVRQDSAYPQEGKVSFVFNDNSRGVRSLCIPDLPWADSVQVTLNGKRVHTSSSDGFLNIRHRFAEGDKVDVSFNLTVRKDSWNGSARYFRGPVQLGLRCDVPAADGAFPEDSLVPVPHLMRIMDKENLQVLF